MKLLSTLFLTCGPFFLGTGAIDSRDAAAGIWKSPVAVKGTSDFIHHADTYRTLDQGEPTIEIPRYVPAPGDQYVLAASDGGRNGLPSQAPATGSQGDNLINCELLLKKPYVDCTGMKKRACGLLTWLYAGCEKAPQCTSKTGLEAKQCCDNRRTLPFGGGAYYEGYMRACAPQYKPKQFDRPVPNRLDCQDLADFTCRDWMDGSWCDMRDWEGAGCDRNAECQGSGEDLAQCCMSRDGLPQGRFSEFFLHRYNQSCMNPIR